MNIQTIKLVCVGDGTVGKTCLLSSYVNNEFPKGYVPTIFDNYIKNIKINNKEVSLSLWDTAGQEEYQKLRSISYPFTDIFLIVFDVSQKETFQNAIQKWYPEISKQQNSKILFVCNKIDLRKNQNQNFIDKKTILSDMGYDYIECSALTQENLQQVFTKAINLILQKEKKNNFKRFCNLL